MTIQTWIDRTSKHFTECNIESAWLDALLLLEDTSNKDRAWLLAHSDDSITHLLTISQLEMLVTNVARRSHHEPIAYILGYKDFYGLRFTVDTTVLIPRPESESMIELLSNCIPTANQRLIDIGTGSGVLAITAKKEFPDLVVTATDVSKDALHVAQNNANALYADIQFVQSDLFNGIDDTFDYIIANLPYVPTTLDVSKEVHTEPKLAVFSGYDGLDCIREFIPQAVKHLNSNGYVFIESLTSQHESIKSLCHKHGLKLTQTSGLIQLFQYRVQGLGNR